MRYGKLSSEELQKYVLDKIERTRSEVLLSAAQGEDCAALKIDDFVLVSGDPITCQMPPFELGSLAADVCCNDISANGGLPVALMLTVIVPPDTQPEVIGRIMDGAADAAKRLNVEIAGGHTEFSPCVVYPIVSAACIGRAKRILAKTALRAGQSLLVSKDLALEGTAILGAQLALTPDETAELERIKSNLSVYTEGYVLQGCPHVAAMHDITEGGIIGSVAEICYAVGLGAEIFESKMPLTALTKRICREKKVDPFRLLSSGSMLIAADNAAEVIGLLAEKGVKCTEIGRVTADREVYFISADGKKEQVYVSPDHIYGDI